MSKEMKKLFLGVAFLSICLSARQTRAQSDLPKFEVGGHFSLIRFGEQTAVNKVPNCLGTNCTVITEPFSHLTEPGFGGRFAYNLSRHLAIEAEMNFFPRDRQFELGRKLEALFGVKVGKRFSKFGVFGKGRPGFLRVSKGDFANKKDSLCAGDFPEPVGCFNPVARTQFAFDVGGVVEYYPTKRVIIRFDAGDTIVSFGERRVVASVPTFNPAAVPNIKIGIVGGPAETTHNFQSNIGVSFRF